MKTIRSNNSGARCIGISVNASQLDESAYRAACASIEMQTGLRCTDSIRDGVDGLVTALQSAFG